MPRPQPIRLLDLEYCYKFIYLMANSADPDQLASIEANWSGSTLFAKAGHIWVQQDKGINNWLYQEIRINKCLNEVYVYLEGQEASTSHQAVSSSDFRSWDPGFKSPWRQNSAHDFMALHCTELFIITHSTSQYDLTFTTLWAKWQWYFFFLSFSER